VSVSLAWRKGDGLLKAQRLVDVTAFESTLRRCELSGGALSKVHLLEVRFCHLTNFLVFYINVDDPKKRSALQVFFSHVKSCVGFPSFPGFIEAKAASLPQQWEVTAYIRAKLKGEEEAEERTQQKKKAASPRKKAKKGVDNSSQGYLPIGPRSVNGRTRESSSPLLHPHTVLRLFVWLCAHCSPLLPLSSCAALCS
jgi:hypothetical protein